jgi:hypothetical protein
VSPLLWVVTGWLLLVILLIVGFVRGGSSSKDQQAAKSPASLLDGWKPDLELESPKRRRHRRQPGDGCPCGGVIYRTSSPRWGPFLGCSNFRGDDPSGCWMAWTLDGRRIRQPRRGVYHIDP